ncbi:hypothetical protein K7X08_000366 [Anisodus acutangulus]|uniref:Apple domain-containing protein n=1 Tax=Anisodus acutangulus TaxID=402998 RepID=A0A9Q1M6L0_9SOLA|nr:hypothetical protein K7X08_000366 [Anisodus acutangulus]
MFRSRSLTDCEHVKFVEIPNVDYWGFDLNGTGSLLLGSCKELCLEDPCCHAFVYRQNGAGTCYTRGILFNRYRSPGFHGSVFLKLPMNLSASESGLLILEDAKCGSPSRLPLRTHIIWRHRLSSGGSLILNLKKATKNFKVELGRGGSGAVYKGDLADGRAIAGSRLSSWVVDDDGECDHEQELQLGVFVRMVKTNIQSGELYWVEKIVDPRLEGKFSRNKAVTLIEIGLSCVEQDRSRRPTMASVVKTLLDCEDETTVLT